MVSLGKKELLKKPNTVKDLALGMATYTGASILGPLLGFCLLGFFLDKYFGTKPFIMIAAVFVAFISTNFLIFKKIRVLMKEFDKIEEIEKAEGRSEKLEENKDYRDENKEKLGN